MRFFITSLVRKLLVFMGKPYLLELLLFQICSRIVLKVVAAAFKLVRCCEFRLLFPISVESAEGGLVHSSFGLLERPGCV